MSTTAPALDLPADSPIRSLAVELQRQLTSKRDLMADTRRVSLYLPEADEAPTEGPVAAFADPLMAVIDMPDGVETFGITRHANSQMAEHLGIPLKLWDRLLVGTPSNGKRGKAAQPDLLADLANGLLSREPATRMLRTMDGRVRAFLSDRYRPRDNWDLLDGAILPTIADVGRPVEFRECSLTETRMYVKIVLPDVEWRVTPKVGDVVRGGVIVSNSEVGAGALMVAPFTDRLICTNGMVHTDFGQRRYHVGRRHEAGDDSEAWDLYSDETLRLDDAAFFAKVSDTVRAALNEAVFERIVAQMRDLAEIRVDGDPVALVEVIATRQGLTESERGSMLTALIDEGDRSAWGYVNAITRTARDLADADRRAELETLAGRMTADPDWTKNLAVAVAA